ncbi:MAG: NAD(P)-dependent oxidoreductase [Victivallaceae bacterium]|nr:NAD(P)-dependent oxidoreductase [Victivallaceae bacterium]
MKKNWKILNAMNEAHLQKALSCLCPCGQIKTIVPEQKVLERNLPRCNAYFASLKVKVSAALIEKCPELKVIATPSTGTDHLPVSQLLQKGIKLINLRQHPEFLKKIPSTAELTWGLLLALLRRIPWAFDSVRKGKWDRDRFIGQQLCGKTIGIIGYGRLGRIVADYALAFNLKVIVFDREPIFDIKPGIKKVSLNQLLESSDIISLHIHLDEPNIGFLGAAEMDKMKESAVILNTSRGAVIDEKELLERLEKGRIAGAAVDVIDGEWGCTGRHPMVEFARRHDNLLITPHIGGASYEAQQTAVELTAQQLKKFIEEASLEHVY